MGPFVLVKIAHHDGEFATASVAAAGDANPAAVGACLSRCLDQIPRPILTLAEALVDLECCEIEDCGISVVESDLIEAADAVIRAWAEPDRQNEEENDD